MQTGVKQGDPLSATLLSIAMDCILKNLELRGNISTRLKQCVAYADDIVISSRTAQAMIDTFAKLKNESLKYGLIVNVYQTGRPLSKIEEDGKSWLRRPKLYKGVVEPYKKKKY